MLLSTSIVRLPTPIPRTNTHFPCYSTGTDSFRMGLTRWMAVRFSIQATPFESSKLLNLLAAFVNQCPIAANNSFTYNFTATDQAGTFWYHSHLATQYCDGLRGPIVIYDPEDPYADLYDVDDGA